MKNWLLFECDYDGETYVGAFDSEEGAKLKAVDLWGRHNSFVLRKTDDDDFEAHASTEWKDDSRCLLWSNEDRPDLSSQAAKIAEFAKEDKARARAKVRLIKKRDSGKPLTLTDRVQLSFYDMEDTMFANIFSNTFSEYGIYGVPLMSTAHPYTGESPKPLDKASKVV